MSDAVQSICSIVRLRRQFKAVRVPLAIPSQCRLGIMCSNFQRIVAGSLFAVRVPLALPVWFQLNVAQN